MNYPLAASTWDKDEIQAILSVILKDRYTMGEAVKEYEAKFAEYIGSKFAVMVNSGSSANLLSIASLFYTQNKDLRLSRGDEIIVPAVSWSTTYSPLQQYGLKLRFVDINESTLNIDCDLVEQAITNKTKAVLAVNLLGNPCNHKRLLQICKKHGIFLIEDNCESLGASIDNKFAGTFGVMGTFSSFFSHHMSTMEGGMVVTDDEELYQLMISIRAHGWTRNLPEENLVSGKKSVDPFHESFKFVLPGYNLRPLEMSGAIGIEQLKKLPRMISARRDNAEKFVDTFNNKKEVQIQSEHGASSWFGFSLVCTGKGISRCDLRSILNSLGVEHRPIVAGNFVNSQSIKYYDYSVYGSLKNSENIDKNGLFIGNHHYDITSLFDLLGPQLT